MSEENASTSTNTNNATEPEVKAEAPKAKAGILDRIKNRLRSWNAYLAGGVKSLKENRTSIRNIGIFAGSIFVFRAIYLKASPLRHQITKGK